MIAPMDYQVVDVFATEVTKGNPVAVVLDAASLSSDAMQSIARWTNLSETTFVIPKSDEKADYHVRIFTPTEELPFAGHPSLGTAHALIEAGRIGRKAQVIQQCKRGSIAINVLSDSVEFGIDGVSAQEISTTEVAASLPGLKIVGQPKTVNAGPLWVVVEVEGDEASLREYTADTAKIAAFSKQNKVTGLCVFSAHSSHVSAIELRTFAPAVGVEEDPVCGSGNAAVAFYRNLGSDYSSYQGSAIQRDGRIQLRYADGMIWVRGQCVTGIKGQIRL